MRRTPHAGLPRWRQAVWPDRSHGASAGRAFRKWATWRRVIHKFARLQRSIPRSFRVARYRSGARVKARGDLAIDHDERVELFRLRLPARLDLVRPLEDEDGEVRDVLLDLAGERMLLFRGGGGENGPDAAIIGERIVKRGVFFFFPVVAD